MVVASDAQTGSADIVGRDEELAVVGSFVEDLRSAPAALVVAGEPGIGKTIIWEEAVAAARALGHRVLTSRPTGAETQLSFAALGDLVGDAAGEVLETLPIPQRRALSVALLLEDPGPVASEPRAIATALLGVLRALARERSLLVAIDDVQWLDAASASALEFAVRRLRYEPVGLLLARRTPDPAHGALDSALADDRTRGLALGALSVGALHHVLRTRFDIAFPRPTLVRIREASGGNPFYALEIARALHERDERLGPRGALPIPPTLDQLVQERLDDLPGETLDALVAAAALANATVAAIERTAPGALESLEPGVSRGVVEVAGDRVRFTHPLLAAAVLARVAPSPLRCVHLRLAEVVDSPEERARHLALGADGPSEEVAAALAAAAVSTARRGAPAAAGEMLEEAVRLTPPASQHLALERMLDAAWQHLTAGSSERAWRLLEPILETAPPGRLRARATLYATDRPLPFDERIELLVRATQEVEGDTVLLAELEREASEDLMLSGDLDQALERARTAAGLSEEADDTALLVQCLGTVCAFETYTGDVTPRLIERAVALEAEAENTPTHYSPSVVLGLRLMYADRLEEARERLEQGLRLAEARGDEFQRRNAHIQLAQLEIRAGKWSQAAKHADEAEVLGEQLLRGREGDLFVRALVDAHLGRVSTARAAAEAGIAAADGGGRRVFGVLNRWALGFLELSFGDAAAAAELLRPLPDEVAAMGYRNPGVRPVLPDAIEALIGVGEVERARELALGLEARGRELDNPWALATGARGLALASAAEGDNDAALASLARALDTHARSPNAFERARTLLTLGATQRRAKQKRSARASLDAALAIFDALPAPLWAEKARAELARIGGRPAPSGELTPTEQRVAALVADGRSNPEVAAALFVTRQTVEKHLSRVYAKLGVRSRVELARRFARGS